MLFFVGFTAEMSEEELEEELEEEDSPYTHHTFHFEEDQFHLSLPSDYSNEVRIRILFGLSKCSETQTLKKAIYALFSGDGNRRSGKN